MLLERAQKVGLGQETEEKQRVVSHADQMIKLVSPYLMLAGVNMNLMKVTLAVELVAMVETDLKGVLEVMIAVE